jgi:hypothetical protein
VAEPSRSYTVFVHGLDAQGAIATQRDMPFSYPSTYWGIGEVFEQRLTLADSAKAVRLRLGVYDAETLQRLTAQSAQNTPLPDDAFVLPVTQP